MIKRTLTVELLPHHQLSGPGVMLTAGSVVTRGSSPTVKEGFVTGQSILEIVDVVAIAAASPPSRSGYCPGAEGACNA